MNILHQNATARLLAKVRSLEPDYYSSWRCIHIRLSDKPEKYNHGLRAHFIARALIERLADTDGYMFLCDDGDIFLLFQGQVKPFFKKLSGHFDDIEEDLGATQSEDSRFTVYDLSIDWKPLVSLAAPAGLYSAFAYSPETVNF